MKRVLVTGGTGFVGRHVVQHLLLAGYKVWMIGRDSGRADSVVVNTPAAFQKNLQCDLLDLGRQDAHARLLSIHKNTAPIDAIVHTAALSSPWGRARDFELANVVATQQMVDFAMAVHVPRFVHISTPSLYFEFADRLDIREDDPLPTPFNHYARTKALAEAHVMARLPDALVLRPRAIFGAWDQTLLPRLLRVAKRGGLPYINDGSAWIDMTYVENLAALIVDCIGRAQLPASRVFNVTNGEPVMVRDLYNLLRQEFSLTSPNRVVSYGLAMQAAKWMECIATVWPDWEPPLTRYSVGVLAHSQTLSIERARSELQYQPCISLAEGFHHTAAWWRASS